MPLLSPLTGIGQYTYHLVREMRQLLPEPPFLFYGGPWSRELRHVHSASPSAGAKRVIGRWVPDAYKIARFLQQMRFSAGVRANRIGLYHEPNYLAFEFPGPTVVTVHDLSWVHYPGMHPAERVKMMNEVMPGVVKRASHIVVDSNFIRHEVTDYYGLPPERVTAVPLGVSPGFAPLSKDSCEPALASRGLRYGEYILTVGTLEPRKNLATVIRAFTQLPRETRRRCPLVVVGMDGWGADRLPDDVRQLAADGEVLLPGYIPQGELPMLYSGARLFAYPSLYEGFGLPPLEAMACGAPVIVSRRASLPEVVGDAAVLVEPLDADEIAAGMRSLLEDDALRDGHSAAGLEQARKFTWRQCALDTLAVYERVIDDQGGFPRRPK